MRRSLVNFVREKKLHLLLVPGSRVPFWRCASECELDTIALELSTVRNRAHRSGVLIQEVYLLERQSFGLEKGMNFLKNIGNS